MAVRRHHAPTHVGHPASTTRRRHRSTAAGHRHGRRNRDGSKRRFGDRARPARSPPTPRSHRRGFHRRAARYRPDLTAAGNMYVITPHGGDFPQPVEVSIPAPTVTLAADSGTQDRQGAAQRAMGIARRHVIADGKLSAK